VKFYTIALYLFIFNMLMGIVNAQITFLTIDWDSKRTFDYRGDSAAEVQQGTEYGDAIYMGTLFLEAMAQALVIPGHYLNVFGFGWAAVLVTSLVWFIYLTGLYQFFSNRGFKQFE